MLSARSLIARKHAKRFLVRGCARRFRRNLRSAARAPVGGLRVLREWCGVEVRAGNPRSNQERCAEGVLWHVITSTKITHGSSLSLDASLSKDEAHAHISFLGLSFEAIRKGNTLYLKGNQAFNARLEATMHIKVPSGAWLKGTTSGLAQIGSFTDISKELPLILSGGGNVTKGRKTTINGQPAITLKETRKLYTGTLYVATTGEPYPLQLRKSGRETGTTTFSGWNDPVNVSAPTNTVEISQLEHKAG